ncbi:MAG: bifunctional folylpolyglutamate synthase/dihydrofolate synthase [Marinicella pacifica]
MKTLDQWLAGFNENKIDLGLSRVQTVLSRPPFHQINAKIITVGGTNGKGSTVTAVSALLNAAGYRVGTFTSPHIFRYNERIQIDGQAQSDAAIVAAFAAIDEIREAVPLSYFEYAFLAGLYIFHQARVDYMVLEVGLGGRLDAVNALDSDLSIITTVDIDHSHWLGDSIEAIAAEKAAIMRSGCVMVYGDTDCPKAILNRAKDEQVRLLQASIDFNSSMHSKGFDFRQGNTQFNNLPLPRMAGDVQVRNFTTALTAVLTLEKKLDASIIGHALATWKIPGRIQTIHDNPHVIVDVAHNRQSVDTLSQYLTQNPVKGLTRAVFSVLKDKQAESWLPDINQQVDHWFIFALHGERALDIQSLKQQLADAGALLSVCADGSNAYHHALSLSKSEDRVIVFGSFHVLDTVFTKKQRLIINRKETL